MMTQTSMFDGPSVVASPVRTSMNGKPVRMVDAKTVINFTSAFAHKLLCDGPTFSTGSACAYSCSFCYVPDLMQKSPHMAGIKEAHKDIVLLRENAVDIMRQQLTRHGKPAFKVSGDTRMVFASPLVDVAANMDLVRETISACRVILELTNWNIRLLSKSNLLPFVARGIPTEEAKKRIVYGVSTGTLNDSLARSFEAGTPNVSKRIESLRWLQDNGHRTYAMICPSLPMDSQQAYADFASECAAELRYDLCEHVWGEVINLRGDSFTRTLQALTSGGFVAECTALRRVASDQAAWERYARATFEAHVAAVPFGKLRFLQYVTDQSRGWWGKQVKVGAVLL